MLRTDTAVPPAAHHVYREFQQISPLPVVVQHYQGVIDVTSIINNFTGDARGDELIQRVEDWEDDNEVVTGSRRVIGLHRDLDPGLSQNSITVIIDVQEAVAQADATRPLTSAAHELGHQLGLEHAGDNPACYSRQPGLAWPDGDSRGDILGIGLDTNPGSGAVGFPGSLRGIYAVFGRQATDLFDPDPATARPPRYFDFMSYCASIGGDASGNPAADNTWISTRYWNTLSQRGEPPPEPPSRAGASSLDRGSASRSPTLTVAGLIDRAGVVSIQRVEPGPGMPNASLGGAPIVVVVRNAAGNVVSSTGVPLMSLLRHDGRPELEQSFVVEVPARGAALVQVLRTARSSPSAGARRTARE